MGSIINSMIEGTGNTLKELGVYLASRGLVMTAAIGATLFGVAANPPVLAAVLGISIGVNMFMRVREMRNNLSTMANVYRNEISSQLGIAPEQVTRAHVHTLAYGDAERGIAPNPILKNEIDREWKKTWLGLGTSLLSAAAAFVMVGYGFNTVMRDMVAGGTQVPTWILGSGVGLVTGVSGLVLNNGLDLAILNTTSLGKYTLHDRIARLDRDVSRGRAVTPERVFSFYVAVDEKLGKAITQRFGKGYDYLPEKTKTLVIQQMGAMSDMVQIADDLNHKRISPGAMAFVLTGQTQVQSASIKREVQAEEQQPELTRGNFAERVGQRSRPELSFAEREDIRQSSRALNEALR